MEAPAAHSHGSPCDHTDLIAQLRAEMVELERENVRLKTERDYFKEQLAARLRQLFAARSEKSDIRQSDLFFNEAEALCPAGDAPSRGAALSARQLRQEIACARPRAVISYTHGSACGTQSRVPLRSH